MATNSELENENQVKHNSDTSLLSENSDNLTDYSSENSSFKKVIYFLSKSKFDTKYPKFPCSKSKSFIINKNFKENTISYIVNEEQNEEGKFKLIWDKENEIEKKIKIPRKKFIIDIKSELDIDLSKFGKLKNKSCRESNYMDTLYVSEISNLGNQGRTTMSRGYDW